jgi:hypothetical protein
LIDAIPPKVIAKGFDRAVHQRGGLKHLVFIARNSQTARHSKQMLAETLECLAGL